MGDTDLPDTVQEAEDEQCAGYHEGQVDIADPPSRRMSRRRNVGRDRRQRKNGKEVREIQIDGCALKIDMHLKKDECRSDRSEYPSGCFFDFGGIQGHPRESPHANIPGYGWRFSQDERGSTERHRGGAEPVQDRNS